MRTTSQVEAMNSSIQRSFPSNTNIFKFIRNLQLFDSIKSSDLSSLHLNEQMKKKRLEDQQRDDKIRLCTTCLKNKDITVPEFLRLMADKSIITPSDGMHHKRIHQCSSNLIAFLSSSETIAIKSEHQK